MDVMKQLPMRPELMDCPYCLTQTKIVVHSYKGRRYRCCCFGRTFTDAKSEIGGANITIIELLIYHAQAWSQGKWPFRRKPPLD